MDNARQRGGWRSAAWRNASHRRDMYAERSSVPAFPAPPLGKLVATIPLDDLSSDIRADAKIENVDDIASFNWLNGGAPSITVPGKPPLWTPLVEPQRLRPDDSSGTYYRDRNAANFPRHPMEATMLAVLAERESKPINHLDIVCCASTLGNLLRFTCGDESAFRMLMEVIGQTVHLVRRENDPKEIIRDIWGYGHTFPEAYTTWEPEVKGSTSHQRVISYTFDGLRLLLRFEGDGYVGNGSDKGKQPPRRIKETEQPSLDAVLDDINTIALSSSVPKTSNAVQVQTTCGSAIPRSMIFELKTRSVKKKEMDCLGQELPRLWIRQIPTFVLAFHQAGTFSDINVIDVQRHTKEWEESNQIALSNFGLLLDRIFAIVRGKDVKKWELVRGAAGPIEIREQAADVGPMLTDQTATRWMDWLERGSSETEDEEPLIEF